MVRNEISGGLRCDWKVRKKRQQVEADFSKSMIVKGNS